MGFLSIAPRLSTTLNTGKESKPTTPDTTCSQSRSIRLVWDKLFLRHKDNRSFTLLLFLQIQNAHTKTQQSATSVCFWLEMCQGTLVIEYGKQSEWTNTLSLSSRTLYTEELWKAQQLIVKPFNQAFLLAVCSYQMIARGQRQWLQLWILPRDQFGLQQQEVPKAPLSVGPVPRRAGHPLGPTEWYAEDRNQLSFNQRHYRSQVQTHESEEAFFFPFTHLHWQVVWNLTHTEAALSYTTKQSQKH